MENLNNQTALGMVETYGYIAHIEAADACLKAANVRLIGSERVKGGYMLVKVMGDVGSVKAAIDAAIAAVEVLGLKAVAHIIPRPSQQIQKLIFPQESDVSPNTCDMDLLKDDKQDDEYKQDKEEEQETIREEASEKTEDNNKTTKDVNLDLDINKLSKLNVAKLRVIARSLKNISLDKNQINFGKKHELVKAILDCLERREE